MNENNTTEELIVEEQEAEPTIEISAAEEEMNEAVSENEATQEENAGQAKIKELEEKFDESESRLLRLQADFDNFRRRSRLDREAAEKYKAQNLISDILPAIDNFERALNINVEDEKTKSILQGMEMVYRSLIDALQKEGLELIESVGQPFDPNLHQAVLQVEDSEHESNIVLEELQKGYKLKDRVIRPSMVKVSN